MKKVEVNPNESLNNLEDIIAQEERYQFESFTQSDAGKLGKIMLNEAEQWNGPVCFSIYLNGCVVFQYLSEGTGPINEMWMRRKEKMVTVLRWSTMRFWCWRESVAGMKRVAELYPAEDIVPCGGGFPITVKGTGVVGAIAVSGLGDQQEHQFILECLDHYFGTLKSEV